MKGLSEAQACDCSILKFHYYNFQSFLHDLLYRIKKKIKKKEERRRRYYKIVLIKSDPCSSTKVYRTRVFLFFLLKFYNATRQVKFLQTVTGAVDLRQ